VCQLVVGINNKVSKEVRLQVHNLSHFIPFGWLVPLYCIYQ
jgi:hypothetical protein